jgi:hypothetical protein
MIYYFTQISYAKYTYAFDSFEFFHVQVRSSVLGHVKGKAIPLQASTGPEGSRRLGFPDFNTVGTWKWQGCQPYAPAAFTPSKYSWYSFLLETESTQGP